MDFIADTCLLIDYEQEKRRAHPGKAYTHFQKYPDSIHGIPWIVLGELASGTGEANRRTWENLLNLYPVIEWKIEISWQYGRQFRQLKSEGRMIGANDLWIAATAVTHGLPVVTRNVDEFRRVTGLDVVGY